jgi:chorismate dehydratase
MVFGKIEYLNLLPFHIFMKRYAKTSRHNITLNYKKGVPSKINADFLARRVDAAFISSVVVPRRQRRVKHALGIIAKKEVLSVLLIPDSSFKSDNESATSNQLAKILKLQGEVLIGDKALKYYHDNPDSNFIDLADLWEEKYHCPFVFAQLVSHYHDKHIQKLASHFLHTKIHIPQYLLKSASQKTGVSTQNILHYLKHISYNMDTKAQQGLLRFKKLTMRY